RRCSPAATTKGTGVGAGGTEVAVGSGVASSTAKTASCCGGGAALEGLLHAATSAANGDSAARRSRLRRRTRREENTLGPVRRAVTSSPAARQAWRARCAPAPPPDQPCSCKQA